MPHTNVTRTNITTADKRRLYPLRYAKKDARTRVYRALYGLPSQPDPKGNPALNPSRKMPQDFHVSQAEATFASLAQRTIAHEGKQSVVSNGLFSDETYASLVRRIDALRAAAKHTKEE